MAKYKLIEPAFINGILMEPGTVVEFEPSEVKGSKHLELIPEGNQAKPAKKA
jgi:hypothetical protein